MATTITRTFDATPTDKAYFSLTDNMLSSSLGNIQVPDGASRISRVDCAFDTTNAKGYQVVCRLSGSNMSEQNFTIMGIAGDTADAAAAVGFNSVPVAFSIAGVNNVDLQIAIQFAAGGSASASSGAVTLYFE
jgi:hypothetical protein|tara:strand:+ start:256 stop:654 length:399 start_codon:yes stop_codon:yes gene_type:complete